MRLKKLIIHSFILLICSSAYAQFPQAAQLVINGDYDGAKNYYLKVLAKDSTNFSANQELGLLLIQYFDDKSEALPYLSRAIRLADKKVPLPELYLGYAQALHYDSQYGAAIAYYEKIGQLSTGSNPRGALIKSYALRSIENCKYGINNPPTGLTSKYHFKNLGPGINTPYPEFLPVLDAEDAALFYTTRRNTIIGGKKDDTEEKIYGDMYVAKNITGKFESGLPFIKQNFPVKLLQSSNDKDGIVSISTNGLRMLICRNHLLYLCELKDTAWTSPVLLPPTINTSPKFDGKACITNDGKIIFFSANKIGGFGRKDLYRSVLAENGEWSEGETLGEDINTAGDEESPFLNAAENTLYFSSNGLDGYGGYDVFKVKISRKGTFKPVNMGLPFNSPADDIYFAMNTKETEGYMASARKGGYGDLDIYHVLLFDKPSEISCLSVYEPKPTDPIYINFLMRDSIFMNDTVSFNANISTVKGGTIMNYFWKINDTTAAAEISTVTKKFTREGRYAVSLETAVFVDSNDCRKDFCVTKFLYVFHPNTIDVFFEPLVKRDENKLSITGTVDVKTLRIDSAKKSILNIKLEPVFFNTNKFDLRDDAIKTIKENIAKMKVDAAIIIKLTALTDPRATKDYNLKLSQKRANAVVAYLEKNGIKKRRIIAVLALGEEEAITGIRNCQHDPICLEKVYQQNRRVDFKIIGAEYEAPKITKTSKKVVVNKAGTKKSLASKGKK